MANNRFNKQVTPKGYKMGGRVKKMGGGMMKRPMYKDGSPKFKTLLKRYTPEESKELMKDPSRKARIKKLLENRKAKTFKEGGSAKKSKKKPIRYVSEKAVLEAATEKNRNPMKDQRLDDSFKGKAVRFKKAMGGSLKPVNKEKNPGLSKLPTEVRNKMGFMQKGGRVGKKFGGGADFTPKAKSPLQTRRSKALRSKALMLEDLKKSKFKKRKP